MSDCPDSSNPNPNPNAAANGLPDEAALGRDLARLIRENVLEGAEQLDSRTNLFDAGLDSMAIMQLLLVIEENYGVMLREEDMTRENLATTVDLARLIRQRV